MTAISLQSYAHEVHFSLHHTIHTYGGRRIRQHHRHAPHFHATRQASWCSQPSRTLDGCRRHPMLYTTYHKSSNATSTAMCMTTQHKAPPCPCLLDLKGGITTHHDITSVPGDTILLYQLAVLPKQSTEHNRVLCKTLEPFMSSPHQHSLSSTCTWQAQFHWPIGNSAHGLSALLAAKVH